MMGDKDLTRLAGGLDNLAFTMKHQGEKLKRLAILLENEEATLMAELMIQINTTLGIYSEALLNAVGKKVDQE